MARVSAWKAAEIGGNIFGYPDIKNNRRIRQANAPG